MDNVPMVHEIDSVSVEAIARKLIQHVRESEDDPEFQNMISGIRELEEKHGHEDNDQLKHVA